MVVLANGRASWPCQEAAAPTTAAEMEVCLSRVDGGLTGIGA